MDKFLKFGAVGVIDSGIGGLTVLNELSKTFPKLNFVYYGDNENAPYGNKSIDELKKLVLKGIDNLLLFNVKVFAVLLLMHGRCVLVFTSLTISIYLIKKAFLSSGKLEKSFQSLCSMLIHLRTCGVFIKNVLAPDLNEYIPVT